MPKKNNVPKTVLLTQNGAFDPQKGLPNDRLENEQFFDKHKRVFQDGGEIACSICGTTDGEGKGMTNIYETTTGHNANYCHECSTGLAATLIASLPAERRAAVMKQAILSDLGSGVESVTETDIAISSELSSIHCVVYPERSNAP